jgi:hypothetical protein
MNLATSRYIFGTTILICHFGAMALYVILGLNKQTGPDALSDILAGALAIAPLTVTYAVTFFRYVVANRVVKEEERQEPVDFLPFSIMYGVTLLFCISLIGSIIYLFNNSQLVGGYENIKVVTSGLEVIFGVFLGLIFSSLFPLQWEQG